LQTVAGFDLLVPQIGEVVGGSVREDRYDVLVQKMKESNLNLEAYEWYGISAVVSYFLN
jgi:asparaginyl-tRNA synthetase